MIYRFDDVEIDTERFELRRGGAAQKVEPQVLALVELLVANADRLVSKDELNLRIWGGRVVSEAVVNSRIRSARLAIGDDGKAQRLIRTVHGRGFRFVGEPVVEDPLIPRQPLSAGRARPEPVAAPTAPAPTAPVAPTGAPSMAVLPFQLLSAEPRYEMLADAIAHEVIVELSRLHWLRVIARGSSFRFRGADRDPRVAGERLGAHYLLTGSVTIEARRSLVTAALSRAADGAVVWAERFEGSLDDLLALRVTIATQVVAALELRLPMLEARRAAALATENLDAWSAYHRGLWHMYRFNAHDNQVAATMFARALDADRGFARAHAGLSFTHFQSAFVGYATDAEAERRLAQEEAELGLALDPLDPFANLTMGRAAMLLGDVESALSWFDRSVELNPNYAFAIYNRALADAVSGLGDKSEAGAVKAMTLSPIDPLRYAMLATRAFSYIVRGDFGAARDWAEQAATAPNAHVHIKAIAALASDLAGDAAAAARWLSRLRCSDPGYDRAAFFSAFPFRDQQTRDVVGGALTRLAL